MLRMLFGLVKMTKKEMLFIIILMLFAFLVLTVLIVRARNVDALYSGYNIMSNFKEIYV